MMGGDSILLQRLTQERKQWRKDHPFGFYAKPVKVAGSNDLNLREWLCGIPGKAGTSWEGGLYKLKITFPSNYPSQPPVCTFSPPIYHPNVFDDGDVCLSILSAEKNWKPSITVRQILLGIQDLLANPNKDDPAQTFANNHFTHNLEEYERRVKAQAAKFRPVD